MQDGYSLVHFRFVRLPNEATGGRFLAADGQHDFEIRPSVYPVPLALPLYPDVIEGTGLPRIDSLGCLSW